MADQTLPRDAFSEALRSLSDNPGAVRTSSTINLIDFYGRSETWCVDTYRVDGNETILLQRLNAEGGVRMVIPSEVAAAMAKQRSRATTANRKRGARKAVETKRAAGIDPAAALRRHRKTKKGGKA